MGEEDVLHDRKMRTYLSAGLDPAAAAPAARRYARRHDIPYWEAITDLSGAAWIIGRGRPVPIGRAWRYAARLRCRRGAFADTGGGIGETAMARVVAGGADPIDLLTDGGLAHWRCAEVASGLEHIFDALRLGPRALARAEGISVSAAHRRLTRYKTQLAMGQLALF